MKSKSRKKTWQKEELTAELQRHRDSLRLLQREILRHDDLGDKYLINSITASIYDLDKAMFFLKTGRRWNDGSRTT